MSTNNVSTLLYKVDIQATVLCMEFERSRAPWQLASARKHQVQIKRWITEVRRRGHSAVQIGLVKAVQRKLNELAREPVRVLRPL